MDLFLLIPYYNWGEVVFIGLISPSRSKKIESLLRHHLEEAMQNELPNPFCSSRLEALSNFHLVSLEDATGEDGVRSCLQRSGSAAHPMNPSRWEFVACCHVVAMVKSNHDQWRRCQLWAALPSETKHQVVQQLPFLNIIWHNYKAVRSSCKLLNYC